MGTLVLPFNLSTPVWHEHWLYELFVIKLSWVWGLSTASCPWPCHQHYSMQISASTLNITVKYGEGVWISHTLNVNWFCLGLLCVALVHDFSCNLLSLHDLQNWIITGGGWGKYYDCCSDKCHNTDINNTFYIFNFL